jgi:hypothetical protein
MAATGAAFPFVAVLLIAAAPLFQAAVKIHANPPFKR